MGGKNRPVYDFLLSIDYAWCHGPVDSINQMWIKDKPIWCGLATSRRNIHVRLPDLFGGDNEGEGGVEGTVEFYPGSYTQFMSEEYARRFPDPTDDTLPAAYDDMPGYRGICHTFFRGGPGLNEAQYSAFLQSVLNSPNGYDPENPEAASSEPAEIGDPINQQNAELGFKWAANNPYLGDTEASISRFPKAIPGSGNWKILSNEPGASVIEREYLPDPLVYGVPTPPMHLDPGADYTYAPYDCAVDNATLASSVYAVSGVYYMPFDQQTINDNKVGIAFAHTFGWGEGSPYHTFSFESNFAISGYDHDDDGTPSWGTQINQGYLSNHAYVGPGLTYAPGEDPYQYIGMWPEGWQALNMFGGSRDIQGDTYSVIREAIFTYYPHVTHCTLEGGSYLLGDANPAQIIFELLTNENWGAGEPIASMGDTWLAVNDVLASENFGLSFIWTRQSEVKEFIQEIIDHIRAFVFIDPQTGLWEIKLLRDDYDATTLDTLDPTNCDLTKYGRRGWGEIVNEITVKYTDPTTEEPATVSSHEPGALAMTGQVIPETRDYHGIRSESLAQFVADRDVTEASYPAFTASAAVSRRFWATVPGDVLKLTWPEEGIAEMIVRVMSVDYGKPTDRTIKLELVEDVFGREQTTYAAPQGSLWESGTRPPQDMPFQQLVEAPLPMLQVSGYDEADVDAGYPGENYILPLGHDGTRFVNSVDASVVAADGTLISGPTNVQPQRAIELTAAMVAEVRSTLTGSVASFLSGGSASAGDLFLLAPAATEGVSANMEIVAIEATDGDDFTILRGVWDTQPRDWAIGDVMWRLPTSTASRMTEEFTEGEDIIVALQERIGSQVMDLLGVTRLARTVVGRAHMPFAPKNFTVTETGSGDTPTIDFTETVFTDDVDPLPTSFDLAWGNRNRTTEEDAPMAYDEGSVAVEAGQTTTIRVFNTATDALIEEHTGETGDTFVLAVSSDMAAAARFYIQLVSVRGGIESLQPAQKNIWLQGNGWGYNWNDQWDQ